MKKLLNNPLQAVDEVLDGMVLADRRLIRLAEHSVLLRRDSDELRARGEVAIVSGGGSGHEPAHVGYVGPGILTAAVAGAVFTSPSVDSIVAAILAVGGSPGVLLIVKNYTGDRLNFGLAAELARAAGIPVEIVIVADDVAIDAGAIGGRGIAGTVLVHKIAGAAAAAGLPLVQVKQEAEAAASALFSMGVGLSGCTVPGATGPAFTLNAGEAEFGLGIHGESGVRREPIGGANETVDALLTQIVKRGSIGAGQHVALLVNNLGTMPRMELDVVSRRALLWLIEREVRVDAMLVGTFLTAIDMTGCSLSLMKLDDQRLERLTAVAEAPAWSMPTKPSRKIDIGSGIGTELPVVGPSLERAASWADPEAQQNFAAAIGAVISAIEAAEEELTRLDAEVGDGDIGISLTRGARAIAADLPNASIQCPAEMLARLSTILRRSLGGTSGPLYAAFFFGMARRLGEAAIVEDVSAWAAAFRAGCMAVNRLGGATVGDCTMMDALLPAADALERAAASGASASTVRYEMADAARLGAEATRHMLPRLGRSTYLGERALGVIDPGAWAVARGLGALHDALADTQTHYLRGLA
tara:strand:- start:2412 stop:4166 length:1755 start_codon:yes stop_codon:yes gene_type:complete